MNPKEFLQTQVIELRRLAEDAADPILSLQLQERLQDAETRLKTHSEERTLMPPDFPQAPRAATRHQQRGATPGTHSCCPDNGEPAA
ncbi:MAG: hypothetical protein R3C59_30790 [Planctomycetaceae bacterium]